MEINLPHGEVVVYHHNRLLRGMTVHTMPCQGYRIEVTRGKHLYIADEGLEEKTIPNCAVEIWWNMETGARTIGWWREEE